MIRCTQHITSPHWFAPCPNAAMSHKDAAEFVGVLLHSSTAAHYLHLNTASYAAHKALGHYYEKTYIKEPLEKRGVDQNLWVWESADYYRNYIVVADVARGDGKDYSTFHVIDTEANVQVAEYRGQIGTKEFGHLLVGIATEYNERANQVR